MLDYYDILGLPRDADEADVRRAYRRLARVVHPDRGGTDALFRLVRQAFDVLVDPVRRDAFDHRFLPGDERLATHGPGPAEEPYGPAPPVLTEDDFPAPAADTTDLSWWHAVDPPQRLDVTPPYHLYRRPFVGTASVGVSLFGGMSYLMAAQAPLEALGAGALSFVTLPFLRSYGRQWIQARDLDRSAPPQVVLRKVFGELPATGSELDRLADRLTDRMLQPLLRIPAVRVVRGFGAPAGSGAHESCFGIACGRRVALVRGRVWPPGRYTLPDGAHGMLLDGRRIAARVADLGRAWRVWRCMLPGAEVQAWVVVHPAPAGEVTFHGSFPVRFLPAEQALDRIGGWLAESPYQVDRAVLAALLTSP